MVGSEKKIDLKTTFKDILDVDEINKEGFKYFQKAEFIKAIECFAKVVQKHPENHNAWSLLAICHKYIENYEGAIFSYKKALEIDDSHSEYWHRLGTFYGIKNKFHKSKDCLQKAVVKDPENYYAWNTFGNTCFSLREYKQAQEYWRNAIVLNEKFCDPHYNFGQMLHYVLQNIDGAIVSYALAFRYGCKDTDTYNQLGLCHFKKGNISKAIYWFSEALEMSPNEHGLWYNLGKAYFHHNELQKSIQVLQKCISLYPEEDDALYNIGICYLHLKNKKDACLYFKKALQVNPKHEEAQDAMKNYCY